MLILCQIKNQMASILLGNLKQIEKPTARNSSDYTIQFNSFETIIDSKEDEMKFDKKKFSPFPELEVIYDENKKLNLPSEEKNESFNKVYNNYLNLIGQQKVEKIEFQDVKQSKANAVYTVKVKLGGKKSINLIAKGILHSGKFQKECNIPLKKGDKVLCRVGQRDEYIDFENIIKFL